MEQIDSSSKRLRWSAIAAGIVSAVALLPILGFLFPTLLIVGGIIQPRFRSAGRVLLWLGAVELWTILIIYDVTFFQPEHSPLYMVLAFPASTILLTWCSAELIFDTLKQLRDQRSARRELQPTGWGDWFVAAVLNLILAWTGYSFIEGFRQSNRLHLQAPIYPYVMDLLMVLIIIAFDVSLARRVLKMKHTRADIQSAEI